MKIKIDIKYNVVLNNVLVISESLVAQSQNQSEHVTSQMTSLMSLLNTHVQTVNSHVKHGHVENLNNIKSVQDSIEATKVGNSSFWKNCEKC